MIAFGSDFWLTHADPEQQYRQAVATPFHDRRRLLSGVLVLLVVVAGQVEAWAVDPEGSPRVVIVLCLLAATVSLAAWWRAPSISAFTVIGALVIKEAFDGPGEVIVLLLCGVLATFAVGLRLSPLRSRVTLAGLLALAAVGVLVGPENAPSELLFSAIVIGGPWAAGVLLRTSHRHADVLQQLAAGREREAADHLRLAAAEERSHIAREVHDLVGHSVSLMILQAGAAEEVVARSPAQATVALQSVQAIGRDALDDLHRVLGLLHERSHDGGLDPVPGLDRLEGLVGGFRAAGLDVECHVRGDIAGVPVGVSLAAFRIVQEGLTNVVRHADRSRATVRLTRSDDALELEILDEGPGATASAPDGHGLVGIRERVAMYAGQLELGAGPGGGFRIGVRLPLEERA